MTPELKVLSFPSPVPKKKKKLRKYERADGRFCKYVTIHGVKKPIYGTSTADVERKAQEYRRLVNYGLSNLDYEIKVDEWCDMWFESTMSTKGPGYQRNIRLQIKIIKDKIGYMKVKDVREIHLQNLLNSRGGMSTSQISQLSKTIKNVFSFARKNRLIAIDPSYDLSNPKGTYKGHRALERWEINLLLQNADIHRSALWALTMMFAGLRRGELLALKTSKIDLDARIIHIDTAIRFEGGKAVDAGTTKTRAGLRDVPIFDPLYTLIKDDLERNPREYFAAQECGKPILSEGGFRGQWETLMRRLTHVNSGYPAHWHVKRTQEQKEAFQKTLKPVFFTPHDLRYTYATFLYNSGVDEKTACKLMGHTDVRMTRDLYAQLTAEQEAKSSSKLKSYFESVLMTNILTNDPEN